MNTCQPEALSALLDGETTPEESAELHEHLARCPGCHQTYTAMAGLSGILVEHRPPALPKAFAEQTARAIKTPTPRWWNGLRALQNHPVRALVAPQRKRYLKLTFPDVLRMVALFGVPALVMGVLKDGAPLAAFVSIAALGLLIGVPLRHFSAEVAVLGSLRRGRCLEEILGTGMSASALVDSLATQGLGELFRSFIPLVPALLLAGFSLDFHTLGLQENARCWFSYGWLLWLPLALALYLSGSYACQFCLTWFSSSLTPAGLGVSSLVFGPPLAVCALEGSKHPLAAILAALLWIGLAARSLTVWGLHNPDRLKAYHKPSVKGRNRWLALWSQNAITRRELSRFSNSLTGGLRSLILWRASLVLMPLLWALWASTRGNYWSESFWTGVLLFSILIFGRAALRTLPAVVNEREQSSWETLLQTHLGLSSFVRGWLEVAAYSVALESVYGVFTLLLFAAFAPNWLVNSDSPWDGARVALLSGLILAGSGLVGALVGLAISSTSRNMREAGTNLLSLSLKAAGAWLLGWGAVVGIFLPYMMDTNSPLWQDLVAHDAPLASETLIGLALWLWSWSTLRTHLQAAEAPQPNARAGRRPYPATVLPLELAGIGFLAYAILVTSMLILRSNENSIEASLAAVALLAAWVLLVRLPLASLAELSQGKNASLAVGLLHGTLLGGSLSWLLLTVVTAQHNHVGLRTNLLSLPEPSNENRVLFLLAGGILGICLGAWSRRARPVEPQRARGLRRRLVVSGAGALVVAAWVGSWGYQTFSRVPLENPAWVSQTRLAAARRTARLNAVRPEDNGFTPLRTLLTERKSVDANHPGPWLALARFYYAKPTRDEDVAALEQTVPGRRALAEFEARQPELQRSLECPAWSPYLELDFNHIAPNFIRMRAIAQELSLLSHDYQVHGRWDEALVVSERGLKWGQVLSGKSMLIHEMLSVATETIALQELLSMQTRHSFTPEQNRRLIRQLETSAFIPENLVNTLENEMTTGLNYFDGQIRGPQETPEGLSWPALLNGEDINLPLPAFFYRYQENVLANTYHQVLAGSRSDPSLDVKALIRHSEEANHNLQTDYPLAIFTRVLMPNVSRTEGQYANLLTRLEAARTIAALQLYRHDHGTWPRDLQQLVGPYLSRPAVCYTHSDRHFDYEVDAHGAVQLYAHELYSANDKKPQHYFPYVNIGY